MVGIAHGLGSLALVLTLGGLVAGCGSDESGSLARDEPTATVSSGSPGSSTSASVSTEPSPTETSAPPDWPSCAKVWVEGADLPAGYAGCLEGDVAVEAQARNCSAGVKLVTYDDRFWGVPGHRISAAKGSLRTDREFQHTVATCTA